MDKSIKQVSNKYSIPISTLYWFKRSADNIKCDYSALNDGIFDDFKSQIYYKTYIYENLKPPALPTTLSKLCNAFNKKYNYHLNKRELKRFIKEDIRFAFKKGSTATQVTSEVNTDIMRMIFFINIQQNIMNDKLIISIYEVSFNRKLVNNYSWFPKSKTSSIINIEASGRWSMITAFLSNGQFIAMLFNST